MDRDVERLAQLLEGAARREDVPPELAELAQLASGLREAPGAPPRPEFRTQLRERLLVEAAELLPAAAPAPAREGLRQRMHRWRRSMSLALASVLSAGALGGVAAAAQSAQPDDVLYGVKRATESVRLALAGDRLAVGRLHLMLADRRLGEVEAGARELLPDVLVATLTEMDEHSLAGANLLIDHSESTGETAPLRELAGFLDDQRRRLRALLPDLPVRVVPFAERSLRLVDQLAYDTGAALIPLADAPASTDGVEDSAATTTGTADEDPDGEAPADPGDSSEPAADADATAPDGDDPIASVTEDLGGTVGGVLEDSTVGDSLPDLESPLPTADVTEPLGDVTGNVGETVGDTAGSVGETVDGTLSDPTELPSLDG